MSKVSDYVDNMFCGLPPTDEVNAIKWQVTESLEDKFAALMISGMSEAEALGTVVSEFGSMEEIYQSLGYSYGGAAPYSAVDPYLAVEYEEFRTKFAVGIGIGVVLCLLATAFVEPIETKLGEMYATSFMILMMAAAVFNFIYWGIRSEKYKNIKKQLEQEKQNGAPVYTSHSSHRGYTEKAVRKITNTVCALIMPVFTILFFLLGVFFGWWHPAWILFPVGGLLCGIVGIVGDALAKSLRE